MPCKGKLFAARILWSGAESTPSSSGERDNFGQLSQGKKTGQNRKTMLEPASLPDATYSRLGDALYPWLALA